MIAAILATWILWTFQLGHPADAKPSGYYYPTEAQCRAAAERFYAVDPAIDTREAKNGQGW